MTQNMTQKKMKAPIKSGLFTSWQRESDSLSNARFMHGCAVFIIFITNIRIF